MAVDYHKQLKLLLEQTGHPAYYELFNKAKTIPCLTFYEITSPEIAHGDTLAYTDLNYQIKVWAKDISTVQAIYSSLDLLMREAGFTRTFATETKEDELLCKITRYTSIGFEKDNN
jgi:hypothetical protein